MTSRQLRALRGTAAAFAATLVAACAHTLGGGGAPPMLLVVAVALLSAPLGVAVVGRSRSLPRLAFAIVAAQVLFHAFFALTATTEPSSTMPGDGGHAMHGTFTADAALGPLRLLPEPPMLVTHLAAAILTIVLVRRGERVVAGIARGIAVRLRLRITAMPFLPVVTPVGRAPEPAAARIDRTIFTSVLSRRGPPAF